MLETQEIQITNDTTIQR